MTPGASSNLPKYSCLLESFAGSRVAGCSATMWPSLRDDPALPTSRGHKHDLRVRGPCPPVRRCRVLNALGGSNSFRTHGKRILQPHRCFTANFGRHRLNALTGPAFSPMWALATLARVGCFPTGRNPAFVFPSPDPPASEAARAPGIPLSTQICQAPLEPYRGRAA